MSLILAEHGELVCSLPQLGYNREPLKFPMFILHLDINGSHYKGSPRNTR